MEQQYCQNYNNTETLQHLMQSLQNHPQLKREGLNEYVKSLLNPNYSCKYPDNPVDFSYVKQILLSRTFKIAALDGFTDEFRLVYPTRSPVQGLSYERKSTDGSWYHKEFLHFTQDIKDPEMYLRQRLVTGFFELYSSTVPIGNTVINGQLNAVKLPYTPGIYETASFSDLLPYATSQYATVNNVSVQEGVTCFVPFKPNCSYKVPDDTYYSQASDGNYPKFAQTDCSTSRIYNRASESHFFKIDQVSTEVFSVSNVVNAINYDPNLNINLACYQLSTIKVNGMLNWSNGNATLMTVRVHMKTIDELGVKQESFSRIFKLLESDIHANITQEFTFLAVAPVTGIDITMGQAPTDAYGFTVTYTQHNYETSQEDNPLLVILGKGQDPETEFCLTGKINVEIMPGTKLKREIAPVARINDDVDDRQIAYNLLALIREKRAFDGIATRPNAFQMMREAQMLDFSRESLANLAFIGPFLSTLGRGLFQALRVGVKYGPAAYELGNQIVSEVRNSERSQMNRARMVQAPQEGQNYPNLAMMDGSGPVRQSERAARRRAQADTGIKTSHSSLKYNALFSVSRQYAYIQKDGKSGLGTLTISNTAPSSAATEVTIQKGEELRKDIQLFVTGFTGELPDTISAYDALEWYDGGPNIGSTRILQFALMIGRMTNSQTLHFNFFSANGGTTSGYSFAFAAEAIVEDLPKDWIYSGDANPIQGMLPHKNMTFETMRTKLQAGADRVMVFKYDHQLTGGAMPSENDVEHIPMLSTTDYYNKHLPMGLRVQNAIEIVNYRRFLQMRKGVKILETPDSMQMQQPSHGPSFAPSDIIEESVQQIVDKVAPTMQKIMEDTREAMDQREPLEVIRESTLSRSDRKKQGMGKKKKNAKRTIEDFMKSLSEDERIFYRGVGYLDSDKDYMSAMADLIKASKVIPDQVPPTYTSASFAGLIPKIQQIAPGASDGQVATHYNAIQTLVQESQNEDEEFEFDSAEIASVLYVSKAFVVPNDGLIFETKKGELETLGDLGHETRMKKHYQNKFMDYFAVGQISNLKTKMSGGTIGKAWSLNFKLRPQANENTLKKPKNRASKIPNPYKDEDLGAQRMENLDNYYPGEEAVEEFDDFS